MPACQRLRWNAHLLAGSPVCPGGIPIRRFTPVCHHVFVIVVSAACCVYVPPSCPSAICGNRESNGCVPGCIAQTGFQMAQTQQAVGAVYSCLRCVDCKNVNESVRTYWAERVLFSVGISKPRTIICWFYIAHRIIDLADSLNERFNLLLV